MDAIYKCGDASLGFTYGLFLGKENIVLFSTIVKIRIEQRGPNINLHSGLTFKGLIQKFLEVLGTINRNRDQMPSMILRLARSSVIVASDLDTWNLHYREALPPSALLLEKVIRNRSWKRDS